MIVSRLYPGPCRFQDLVLFANAAFRLARSRVSSLVSKVIIEYSSLSCRPLYAVVTGNHTSETDMVNEEIWEAFRRRE
jgi:hypothetical protein